MAKNKLCPRDYSCMVINFINKKRIGLRKRFSVEDVVEYCIKKTEILDYGDDIAIRKIVKDTLRNLQGYGCLNFYGSEFIIYRLVPLDGHITISETHELDPKNLNKSNIDKLNNIAEETKYTDGLNF